MAGREPSGALELTWSNKDLALLSHGDESYEWVEPSDYRVSEVRLLDEVDEVGADNGNLLIQGDALHALTALVKLPDYAKRYVGKVKLCYIDPPFNTGQAFRHYDDNVESSVWLTLLRDRLTQIHELLAPDGSVWVHLDDAQQHRARCVLDEVFGADNFVATVIWEKTDSPRMDAKLFSARHDYVHVYRKGDTFSLNQLANAKSNATKVDEGGRPYYLNPLRARGGQGSTREARPNLYYAIRDPDGNDVFPKLPDGTDGAWRWSKEKLNAEKDRVEWTRGKGGWNPNYRIYEEGERTKPPETLWTFAEVGSTRNSAKEIKDLLDGLSFSTPKPERLLERAIHIGSNPGDIVLDCFAGSGTTAAVAHKMGRRWVTVELSPENVETFVRPRLTKVVEGTDPGGVTSSQNWEGGGGFTVATVGPSMFETTDGGRVVLADWVTGGELAELVAAQLGYDFEVEGPFAGRKGRSRLAVIDGVLGLDVAKFLVGQLADNETLLVVAQAVEPGVAEELRLMRRGSRVRKVPRDIAKVGDTSGHVVTLNVAPTDEVDEGEDLAENDNVDFDGEVEEVEAP